ncbi:MAG: diversity-generating retroelement protein Avd [Chloroflexi bacterium]|nr:diversity-generating retroelement protein Avd [Chloroflexota bacterium]
MPDSPIFVKMHDLNAWLLPRTLKFPREYRFSLASRIQTCAFDLQRALIAAAKSRTANARGEALHQADLELAELRLHLRLATDLKLLDPRGYARVARLTEEVGRLLGGWQKKSA